MTIPSLPMNESPPTIRSIFGKRHSGHLTSWERSVPSDAVSFVEREHLCCLSSILLLVMQLLVRQFLSTLLQLLNAKIERTPFCRHIGRLDTM